jgi:hypothetical protein
MARRRFAVLLFAIAVAISLPTAAALAAFTPTDSGTGLVPCGVSSDPNVATECEACNVVQLVQNVIIFMIGIAIPIAMAMFAWAGILYFTSATNSENIGKAKRIFSSSMFGFVLALAAWLIVNTVLFTVLDHNKYPESSWFKIDCSVIERPRTGNVGDVLASHLGIAPEVVPIPTGVTTSLGCNPGQTLKSNPGGSYCENPDGTTSGMVSIQIPTIAGVGLCSASNLATFGNSAGTMSCILQAESSCNPTISGDKGFSIGLAQINMSANNVTCNGQVYLCPQAFSGSYTCKNGKCGRFNGSTYLGPVTINNQTLADRCRTMLQNPVCNLETAKTLLATSRGLNNWSTYGKCK